MLIFAAYPTDPDTEKLDMRMRQRVRRLARPRVIVLMRIGMLIFTLLFTSVFPGTGNFFTAKAQEVGRWTPQQRITGIENEAYAPILVADSSGSVHAFMYQRVGPDLDETAIVYLKWTLEEGWTTPVDILLSPIKQQARRMSAYLDPRGVIHLIFFGGDETEANFYYAQALAVEASNANAWTTPVLIGENALIPETVAITGDGNGTLVAVYSGQDDGNGLYSITSVDDGVTWSTPIAIFLTSYDDLWPFYLRFTKDHTGAVNAVWNVVNSEGHGEAGYFARLDPTYTQWSTPLLFAKGIGLGVLTPNIVEYNDELVLTYYNGDVNNNWLIQSQDSGQSWTRPLRISPTHVGQNGIVSLSIDSSNVLHMLFGSRIQETDIHGMWHSTWQDGQIIKQDPVVSKQRMGDIGSTSLDAFDPSRQEATIVRGNILLVVWETDTAAGENGLWFSYGILDAPELPAQAMPQQRIALPTVTPRPHVVLTSTPAPAQIATPTRASPSSLAVENTPPRVQYSSATALVVGAAPVIIIILIAGFINRLRRRG